MGHKTSMLVAFSGILFAGLFATITFAFADEEMNNSSNPFSLLYNLLQEWKYDGLNGFNQVAASDTLYAAVIVELQNEVEELRSRMNSIDEPSKVYTTELYPVTNIDCSFRNNAEAFLSGWCPHPSRNIYFIEDSRVLKDSIIAVNLNENLEDGLEQNTVCGVINQDTFSFSFHDPQTGKVKILDDLHGFIMKCDQNPVNPNSILKYTIVNT